LGAGVQIGQRVADLVDVFDVHGDLRRLIFRRREVSHAPSACGFSRAGLSEKGLRALHRACQKDVSASARQSRSDKTPSWPGHSLFVLTFLNLVQLLLYIPLLALLGQGVLYALAGAKRNDNFFYQLLQLLSKPFTSIVRKITPAKVGDHQVPVVTFFLLLIVYAVVTFEKINLCVALGVEQCK
jgi:hypothetical protein